MEHLPDEAEDLLGEVGRICPHHADGDSIDHHDRQHRGNSPRAVGSVGGGDEKEQGQIRPAAQDGMDLEAKDGAFPSGGIRPSSLGILLDPRLQQGGIQNHVPAFDDAHLQKLEDHPPKEQKIRPKPQALDSAPKLRGAYGLEPSLRIPLGISQGQPQPLILAQPAGDGLVA